MNEDQHDESSRPPEWRVGGDEQLKTSAYHIWKPRPLLRSVHWKPTPAASRDAAAGSYDVFIDQRAFSSVHQHLWDAGPGDEPFGFLVGDLCEDPDTGRRYLIVSAAIPSKFPLAEEGPEQVPGEAVVAMQLEVDRRRGVLAGWYHRHESGAVELTAEDMQTHEKHFPEPWHVALLFVTDFAHPAGGCFRRTRDGLSPDTPLPFFEMVSNESLLARGVRRSHLDWINMETVDSIEVDPLSRPEPESGAPAEPEEPEPEGPAEPAALVDGEAEEVLPALPPEAADGTGVGTPAGEFELEPSLEDESSALESEDVVTGVESADEDLTLPVLEEFALDEPESEEEVDSLPEPGWDSEDSAADVSIPVVEDVDLDSFVTEVETADVAAQVDETLEPEEIEPDWDEAPADEVPVDEVPVDEVPVDEVPVDDAPAFDLAAELGIEEEPAAQPEEPTEALTEPAPATMSEQAAGRQLPRLPRNTSLLVGGLLVVAAIVTTLLVIVLPSGSESDGGLAETDVVPALEAEAAQGQEGQPVDDAPLETGESGVEEPFDSPPAADSSPSSVSAVEMEQLGDALLESVSRYYGRAVAVDEGRATCADLQIAYVEVEDRWIAYNVQGRARFEGRLPEELATRDERLYAGVQDVEREFTRSGCERP
jgi:proteasome lid subunit RPN8/RPN11